MSKPKHPPKIPPYPPRPATPLDSVSMRPTVADMKRGIRIGLLYGAGFSVFALIIYSIAGSRGFERSGVSVGSAIALYLVGGAVAGLIAGTFHRVATRSPMLMYAIGIVVAAPVAFGSTVLVSHRAVGWGTAEWGTAITASVIYGILGVRLFRA